MTRRKTPQPAEALVAHPGDTVVLRFDHISQEDIASIRDIWRERVGGLPVVIVQADQIAVIRTEDTPREDT